MAEKTLPETLYQIATGEDEARLCRDIPDSQCNDQPINFLLQVISQAFSKTGDALADAKVVLPWLIGAVGAPVFLIGFLVPIRESLALLPQVLVGGVLRRFAVRKFFWAGGSAVEGCCILGMALVGMSGMTGAPAGWAIVGLLVLFSLARGIASIAAKDTLGKTVSKTRRGRVSGYAATASGLVASLVGFYLALAPDAVRPDWLLYGLLIAAAAAWFAGGATHLRLREHPGATEGAQSFRDLIGDQMRILLADPELRRFLAARTFMIATSLLGPVFVAMAQARTGQDLSGLGWLILASGLASALSASFWGRLSDVSSRNTMAYAAGFAGILGLSSLAVVRLTPSVEESVAFYAGILFLLGIAHAGIRIGRKTHIVDLAGMDRKAEYVALSNSIIGVLLLAMGAFSGLTMAFGLEAGVLALSVMALAGATTALTMRNVQTD